VIKQRLVCLESNLCQGSNSSKSMLVFLEIVSVTLAKNTPLFEAFVDSLVSSSDAQAIILRIKLDLFPLTVPFFSINVHLSLWARYPLSLIHRSNAPRI
jgi:hypothetical protein